MQPFIYFLGFLPLALDFPPISAFSRPPLPSWGRSAALPAPLSSCRPSPPAIGANRAVCTSLAVTNLDRPEPPAATVPWAGVGIAAVLILLTVSLGMQAQTGQMLAQTGQTLATLGQAQVALSSKFDQVTFFIVGVIALATFGSSTVNILRFFNEPKKTKVEDEGKGGKGGKNGRC